MTDPLTEGYVGITKHDLNVRLRQHKNYKNRNVHLKSVLNKYTDIVIECLYEGTEDECKQKEFELRSQERIGWNLAVGGSVPPPMNSRTAKKISDTLKRKGVCPYDASKTHSPEAIAKANAKKVGRKWTHNPLTGEQKMRKPNDIPTGWKLGRIR